MALSAGDFTLCLALLLSVTLQGQARIYSWPGEAQQRRHMEQTMRGSRVLAFGFASAIITSITIIAPTASAAPGTGGRIEGSASCSDNVPLTRIRVQASTGEGADATITRYDHGSLYKNNSLAYYEVAMTTIRGQEGSQPGTKVKMTVYCGGTVAGGMEEELGPRSSRVWPISLGNCGPRARVC